MCYRGRAEACDIGAVAQHVDVGQRDRALSTRSSLIVVPIPDDEKKKTPLQMTQARPVRATRFRNGLIQPAATI